MATTEATLSLDHGDVVNLSALIHNTLALHQAWREIIPVLNAHAPLLAAKCVDRITDNAFITAGLLRDRHAGVIRGVIARCEWIRASATANNEQCHIAHSQASHFVDQMNALASGLLDVDGEN